MSNCRLYKSTVKNGGDGYRPFKPLYSSGQEQKLKGYRKKFILDDVDKGVYKYKDIPFKVNESNDR